MYLKGRYREISPSALVLSLPQSLSVTRAYFAVAWNPPVFEAVHVEFPFVLDANNADEERRLFAADLAMICREWANNGEPSPDNDSQILTLAERVASLKSGGA